jgi:arabinan endo-1,5-alpha-L-arabinosidase
MSLRWKTVLTFCAVMLAASSGWSQSPHVYNLSGDVAWTHDPSIAKDGDTWYVFATGKTREGGPFAVRCSTDLEHWKLCGQVFDAIPEWIQKHSPGTKDL